MQDSAPVFDHERLEVYQESIAFITWLSSILEGLSKAADIKDQLERAATSIALNIAEGNGKYSVRDRSRFFDMAAGSAFEGAAALDVLVAKGKLTKDQVRPGKERLLGIVRMLVGLLKTLSQRSYPRMPE